MVCDKLKEEGHGPECLKESFVFVNEFISRFGCWKQLQISACLSDKENKDVWNGTSAGNILREIVVSYNWYSMKIKGTFEPQTEEIEKELRKGREFKERIADRVYDSKNLLSLSNLSEIKGDFLEYKEKFNNTRNLIKIKRGVLTINGKLMNNLINIVQWGGEGFLYKRTHQMKHIPIKKQDFTDEKFKSINDWLEHYSALCLKTDSESITEAPTGGDLVERRSDIDGYFSGWRIGCK